MDARSKDAAWQLGKPLSNHWPGHFATDSKRFRGNERQSGRYSGLQLLRLSNMTGICGWFGVCEGNADDLIRKMCKRITWEGAPSHCSLTGTDFGLAAVGPSDTIFLFEFGPIKVALHGHVFLHGSAPHQLPAEEICEHVANAYRKHGQDAVAILGGDFALAIVDLEKKQALLAIDRIGVRNLVYRFERGVFIFAASLDALAAHPFVNHRVAAQAIYNYVYFHMVPGPSTIFERSFRLLPGHCVIARSGELSVNRYWQMPFVEDRPSDIKDLERKFNLVIRAGVGEFASEQACGTFLSGGTDSSTVTGILANLSRASIGACSIGFDAAGYDEMEYARIAARHFKTKHYEYYVTPADVLASLPLVAAEYDQPFGNASAVPTYYCAKLAKSVGIARMLAGDGGDELFGGNARYAHQHQLSHYERIPSSLRSHLIEPILRTKLADTLPVLRKARSYIEQARLSMPARYETYNLLERLGAENVFDQDFLAMVDRNEPLNLLSAAYDSAETGSLINRMIAIDLKFTLADNDLPKVTRMCDRAGVDVAFPLLHDSVVAFSAALPPQLKLRGTKLRYFFRKSLRDFLPPEVIEKKKHGFGLPAGLWLASYPPLQASCRDALASLRMRRVFRSNFLDRLINNQLHEHAAYYGTMLWILMMLELWYQEHVDRR